MRRFCFFLLIVTSVATVHGQYDPPGFSKASAAYHDYRLQETEPSYGLAKVKALVKNIKDDSDDTSKLADSKYQSLSVPEKFTFCMIHGELFSQNCDGMPGILNEEKQIFAQPIDAFGNEENWSERQIKFLHGHRSEVVRLLHETIQSKHRVGANLKKAIIEINAFELIPDLVTVFKKSNKDLDILSVLCVLMKQGKYPPFLKSITYRKFYGPNSSYKSSIVANQANRDLVVQRAMAYYQTRKS